MKGRILFAGAHNNRGQGGFTSRGVHKFSEVRREVKAVVSKILRRLLVR